MYAIVASKYVKKTPSGIETSNGSPSSPSLISQTGIQAQTSPVEGDMSLKRSASVPVNMTSPRRSSITNLFGAFMPTFSLPTRELKRELSGDDVKMSASVGDHEHRRIKFSVSFDEED